MAVQIKPFEIIKSNSLFKNINESDIKIKVNTKNLIEIKDGEIIFQTGDSANSIFLIGEGEVKIKHSSPYEGKRIFIKSKDDFFGEKELLENTSRTSSAVAQTECVLYSISQTEINDMISRNRMILKNLHGLDQIEEETLPTTKISDEPDADSLTATPPPLNLSYVTNDDIKEQAVLPDDLLEDESEKSDNHDSLGWNISSIEEKYKDDAKSGENILSDGQEDDSGSFWGVEQEQLENNNESKIGWDFSNIEQSADQIIEEEKRENIPENQAFNENILNASAIEAITPDENDSNVILAHISTNIIEPLPEKGELSIEQFKLLIEAAEKVNSNIKIDDVLKSIVEAAILLTKADRGTLYVVDNDEGIIWSKVIDGENIKEIRLKFGQGLAGWVAQNGETINIKDASTDPRFDAETDKASGYHTKSMLCFPIRNRNQVIIGVLQLLNSFQDEFTDTDEKFLEAMSVHAALALENATLVQQLLRTDRLTSLGKVAHFIINDMKKPILTIKSLVEHIKKKNIPQDTIPVVNMISEQASVVLDIVQTTLSYSEGKTILQTRVQSLHALMDEILEMLAEYVESRNVKLFKKYSADVFVNADKKELYQAIFQITKNACDAMAGGGNFYVTTLIEEGFVKISFKDTGLGIPESLKERIFEPYMSQGKKLGVGLGLPIAEKIIKEHNGKITVESEVGEGANFIISIPVHKKS
jgi:signal transduction histidine kinase